MSRTPGEEARRVAHRFCDAEEIDAPCTDDCHSVVCDRLTAALQPYLTALQRIAEYETDWTQGPAANVNALQTIAEAALLGRPGRTE